MMHHTNHHEALMWHGVRKQAHEQLVYAGSSCPSAALYAEQCLLSACTVSRTQHHNNSHCSVFIWLCDTHACAWDSRRVAACCHEVARGGGSSMVAPAVKLVMQVVVLTWLQLGGRLRLEGMIHPYSRWVWYNSKAHDEIGPGMPRPCFDALPQQVALLAIWVI